MFFDGKMFRLERLHRAVKQLRHDRQPGESAVGKGSKPLHVDKSRIPAVLVERIDIGQPDNSGAMPAGKGIVDPFEQPNVTTGSPDPKNDDSDEHQDIDIDDIFGAVSPEDNATEQRADAGFDISVPRNDSDEEIADVDDSGDEANRGPNAAEALRAQVHAAEKDDQSSSSSSSSGSSGSGSSSSSNEDSVNSI